MTIDKYTPGPTRKRDGVIAAAGGGTLAIFIIENAPLSPEAKRILIYSAPSITVALKSTYIYCKEWSLEQLHSWRRNSKIKLHKKSLEEALCNPHTSPEHKEMVKREFEKIEKMEIDENIKSIPKFPQSKKPPTKKKSLRDE